MRQTSHIDGGVGVLLMFPPLWTPVTPYIALPLLVGYLRKEGLSVKQYDASLDFIVTHLLKPDTLFDLLAVIERREKGGDYSQAPKEQQTLLHDLKENRMVWVNEITGVHRLIDMLREEAAFFDPGSCIKAQGSLYNLLKLASLAYYPTAFTFNTFFQQDHKGSFPDAPVL